MKVDLKMLYGLGYFGLKMIKTFLVIVMGMILEMGVSMPYTQRHQFTQMQNMQQMSPGQLRLMISSRYFIIRPALKGYVRMLSGYYLAARQLEFFKGRSESRPNMDSLLNLGIVSMDKKSEFSILVYRATGGASIEDGEVEIMLHRRTIYDDSRGLGEPLDETVCRRYV